MDEVIAKYVYAKVLDDFRAGRPLPQNVGASLDTYAQVDRLRSEVSEEDVPTLLRAATGEWTDSAALAVSLLRHYATRPDVRVALRTLWQQNTRFACRYEVAFRLLDDPDLPIEWHREIYQFARAHRREFLEASVAWAGGARNIFNRVATRLSDPSFPRAKAWIYLFIATGSNEHTSVIELLKVYANGKDFAAAVATELLEATDEGGHHAFIH